MRLLWHCSGVQLVANQANQVNYAKRHSRHLLTWRGSARLLCVARPAASKMAIMISARPSETVRPLVTYWLKTTCNQLPGPAGVLSAAAGCSGQAGCGSWCVAHTLPNDGQVMRGKGVLDAW